MFFGSVFGWFFSASSVVLIAPQSGRKCKGGEEERGRRGEKRVGGGGEKEGKRRRRRSEVGVGVEERRRRKGPRRTLIWKCRIYRRIWGRDDYDMSWLSCRMTTGGCCLFCGTQREDGDIARSPGEFA